MPRRRKATVRTGRGAMCNICGKNCGKGGALKKHVEHAPHVSYEGYRVCFYDSAVKTVIADAWDDSVFTSGGRTVVTHVLVRRFVEDQGPRGATRSVSPGSLTCRHDDVAKDAPANRHPTRAWGGELWQSFIRCLAFSPWDTGR